MINRDLLVWIDLEMTGLNPDIDVILEIATIITDNSLTILAEGPSIVIHQSESALSLMDSWVSTQHTKTGLVDAVHKSSISLAQAEEQTLTFLKQYCVPGTAVLAGNSVWQDRAFLRKWMPHMLDYLHYRLVDVSSIKEVVQRWYPNNPHVRFSKPDNHRALEDIRFSIKELHHYRSYFFNHELGFGVK